MADARALRLVIAALGMLGRGAVFGLAAAFGLAASGGCGTVRSTAGIIGAEAQITAARTAGAARHAPFEFSAAELYLSKAREEQSYAELLAAADFADRARGCALLARRLAEARVAEPTGDARPERFATEAVCLPGPPRPGPAAHLEPAARPAPPPVLVPAKRPGPAQAPKPPSPLPPPAKSPTPRPARPDPAAPPDDLPDGDLPEGDG